MSEPLHLFEGYGVELEYMIVDRDNLDVLPISDEIIKEVAGEYTSEVELGPIAWCNEVVLHVLEIKTNGPASSLVELPELFLENVNRINRLLVSRNAFLMPTGMHPWMNPFTQTKLWPHEYSPVYESYNRIFGCKGHGWSNLQSLHLNLPFANDEEFGRLHAAIRLVLPILPGLAASSPVMDGKLTGFLDNRLEVYRGNQRKIPSITGSVIPEAVFSREQYQEQILNRIYQDISPYDPDDILQYEWLNSRGAIARFERNTIEIRVLDLQECPLADLSIYALIVEVLKALIEERWISYEEQQKWQVAPLAKLFEDSVREAGEARIDSAEYLRVFGQHKVENLSVRGLWKHLFDELIGNPGDSRWTQPLSHILDQGSLASRIRRSLGNGHSPAQLKNVYASLVQTLEQGELFGATD
ncbi:MAG: glutamate--cysteine ligase [Acidobacteriota bacterium]|nr:MAG: glutamate--cysteine ligase [Acidobacteriota bacterium]